MKLERDYLDIIVAVRLLGGRERGCVKKDGPGNEVEALRGETPILLSLRNVTHTRHTLSSETF